MSAGPPVFLRPWPQGCGRVSSKGGPAEPGHPRRDKATLLGPRSQKHRGPANISSSAHINTLKQALNHGLKLKKIHRVIKFNKKEWSKPYIDMNTELRKSAKK